MKICTICCGLIADQDARAHCQRHATALFLKRAAFVVLFVALTFACAALVIHGDVQ